MGIKSQSANVFVLMIQLLLIKLMCQPFSGQIFINNFELVRILLVINNH